MMKWPKNEITVENLEIDPFAPTVEKVENNTQTEIIGEIIKIYEKVNAENEKFIIPDTTPPM